MQYLKQLLWVVFKNWINMHQRGLDWTCLRRRPRQTPAGSPGSRVWPRTHGTGLQRPHSLARSLRQLKARNDRNRQTNTNKYSHKFIWALNIVKFV